MVGRLGRVVGDRQSMSAWPDDKYDEDEDGVRHYVAMKIS